MDEALDIAKQIAEALEEAHEKGIVHRDLKPRNVKLTPEGKVKVLDFGLAKALAGAEADGVSAADASRSPTLTRTGTQAGVILGTAAYMSPEQARGKAVDKRTDIWAFGVVLFEMLAGKHLFAGDSLSDILVGVLTTEPDFGLLPAETPARVRDLLRRCLTRDPRERLRDIGDARLEIAAGTTDADATQGRGGGMTPPARPRWTVLAIMMTALAASLLTAGAVWLLRPRTPDPLPVRFTIYKPEASGRESRISLPLVGVSSRCNANGCSPLDAAAREAASRRADSRWRD